MAKRICKVCGGEYDYCPGCPKYQDQPRWKISFDCENCKDIFDTLVKQSTDKITVKEARRALYRLDLQNRANFNEDIQRHLNSVMATRSQNSEDEK